MKSPFINKHQQTFCSRLACMKRSDQRQSVLSLSTLHSIPLSDGLLSMQMLSEQPDHKIKCKFINLCLFLSSPCFFVLSHDKKCQERIHASITRAFLSHWWIMYLNWSFYTHKNNHTQRYFASDNLFWPEKWIQSRSQVCMCVDYCVHDGKFHSYYSLSCLT